LVQQRDLVVGLNPSRLKEHLLAVNHGDAQLLKCEQDGQFDDVHPQWLVRETKLVQLSLDLGG
jgi:hypothetical protein